MRIQQLMLQLLQLLLALLLVLAASSNAQVCTSSRGLSSRPFGFVPAPSQGVNTSYAYIVFVMNVTESGSSSLQCNSVAASRNNSLLGMQKVQAAAWSVQTFRTRYPAQLPGVTIGALILDSCQSSTLAALQLSNMQSCETAFGTVSVRVQPDSAIAFVGIETLAEAEETLPLLRSVGKPAVSYQLTAESYDTSPYPLLARLSPSDNEEAAAMVALLQSVNARHVQIVMSSSSSKFSRMAAALQSMLEAVGICAVNRVNFSNSAASSVNSFASVRPVVLLLSPTDLVTFATQMLVLRPASGTFTWLLTSELRRAAEEAAVGRENFFAGSVAVQQMTNATGYSDFQNYFKSLNPSSSDVSSQNPWFNAFWSQYFSCNLPGSSSTTYTTTCNYADATQNLQSMPGFNSQTAKVIQSVDLVLHSMELTRRQLCGDSSNGLCSSFLNSSSRFLSTYSNMYNSSLPASGFPRLQANGGPDNASLQIENFQKLYPGHVWRSVGSFQFNSLQLSSSLQAYGTDERNTSWTSACGFVCDSICQPNASSTTDMTSAMTTTAMTPNTAIPGTLRRRNWIYALIVCACVGIIVTVIFFVFIVKTVLALPSELKTFTTLWSGKVLLFIIFIGYVSLFAWLPWPTPESCGVIRFMVGFVYVCIFSILMVKLLNLMNAFLQPEYQLLLFVIAIAVQVATSVEWLILVPADINATVMSGSRCSHGFLDHLQALVYSMFLILICTVLSVAAHAIGKNNRESIFIGCATGISIPIWIAWSLVGSLSLGQDFEDASMAFGLFINLTLVLLVIFLPKIHRLRQLAEEEAAASEMMEKEDSIYVLTGRAPSVKSDGTIFVAAQPGNAKIVTLPDFPRNAGRSRPQSLAGDRPNASLSRVIGGAHHPHHTKAYSEYNGAQGQGNGQRHPGSLPQRLSSQLSGSRDEAPGSAKQKLSRLGFL